MGPALIGIEIQNRNDLDALLAKMKKKGIVFEYLNDKPDLLQYLV